MPKLQFSDNNEIKLVSQEQYLLEYNAENQPYSAYITPGRYYFECWGAQGGHKQHIDKGKGGYTAGEITFNKGVNLFFYVGEAGSINSEKESFNGGGPARISDSFPGSYGGSGGGATDIRLKSGNWGNEEGLKSRIMVAAGGGGCINYIIKTVGEGYEGYGGSGGGLTGYSGNYSQCFGCVNEETLPLSKGGGQDSQDLTSFGRGMGVLNGSIGGGGGSGYFGGEGGIALIHKYRAGAGGSSFISGHDGCQAFTSIYNDHPSTDSSIHYSGHYFINTVLKNGDESFPSPTNHNQNETGHMGNGFIRISVIEYFSVCSKCSFSIHISSFLYTSIAIMFK